MIPKVTLIVPVYNVEPYLPRCLDSLCDQTLQEIEILLIDDGSTDASGQILDRYARRDDRFQVVHQDNRGLSAVRNLGIDLARAPYIMFADSDDWVEPDFCRIPWECAEKHEADLILFRCWRDVSPEGGKQSDPLPEGICSQEEAMRWLYHGAGVWVWNKLYKKHLFQGVRYPVGRVYEDHGTTHLLVRAAARIYMSDKLLYHYCWRPDSIVRSTTGKDRYFRDYLEMKLKEAADLRDFGFDDLSRKVGKGLGLSYLVYFGTKAKLANQAMQLCREERMPANGSWKVRTMWAVLQISPALFDLICALTGKRKKPDHGCLHDSP